MSLQIIITGDGSHSLRNSELDETYHSSHGAIQESKYVFIESGLKYVLKRMISEIQILEIGFGTGLNAFQPYFIRIRSESHIRESKLFLCHLRFMKN